MPIIGVIYHAEEARDGCAKLRARRRRTCRCPPDRALKPQTSLAAKTVKANKSQTQVSNIAGTGKNAFLFLKFGAL